MDKIDFLLPRNKWGTIKSKYRPEDNRVTPDEFTLGSYNFITNVDGTIEKRPTNVKYNPTALNNIGKDQFEAIFTNGTHHLLLMDGTDLRYTTGDNLVTTAHGGFTATASMEYAMYQNRVYMDNGVDSPGVYDITASYGGVTYTPPQYKAMGAQPPVAAPTFAADSGTGLTGSYHYKVTFLYYGFEESNGGPASALHTVVNKTINLTAIPIGGYGVTARKIYRDANDGVYLLVATISDNTTTVFADAVSAGTTLFPSSNNTPPVFSYIALSLSRLWVAGVSGTPTTLYWSNPGLPDIFDPSNFVVCNPKDPIQAIYVYQGIVIILNRHSIGQILGNTDDTFFYQEVPGNVGCVDNRSIQVRTIDGVPVLVWLSDRGLYSFNGSSVVYISDAIEDEVNLNIAQVNFVTGSNNQSTAADWAAGTSSPGIDLASNPGTIQTIDPTRVFESQADWELGSLTNIATIGTSNSIQVPTSFSPTLASGTVAGSATVSGTDLVLPVASDNDFVTSISPVAVSGGFYFGIPLFNGTSAPSKYAQSFTVTAAGTITSLKTYQAAQTDGGSSADYSVAIFTDALGNPGVSLWSSGTFTKTTVVGNYNSLTSSPALAVTPGTYWIVTTFVTGSFVTAFPASTSAVTDPHVGSAKAFIGSTWLPLSSVPTAASLWRTNYIGTRQQIGPAPTALPYDMTFVQTPVAASGTWASAIYDSKSSVPVGDVVINTGTYPTSCSGTLYVDASNDSLMGSGVTTVSFASANGSNAVATTNLRYWRLRYSIATTDNRRTPTVTAPNLRFNITGTWISPSIETTLDGTTFISLPVVSNLPAGTTATTTIRTSADGISWSAYSAIGSAVMNRYAMIKIILTATSDDTTTPSVSSVTLNWNLSSTFSALFFNVGQVPSGWGLFQDVQGTAGTVAFSMRSAASSGALGAAVYHTVSNGTFPDVAIVPLQFAQWKVVLTASPGNVPTVESVTVNWFVGNNQNPIRVASLFYDKTYYLAAAETGNTANNVVIVYDFEGNWRLFRDVNINSLSLFFNQPFYCDALVKFIYQWLIPSTGTSESITMDVRTKAFDLLNVNNLKNVRSFRVTGINTGATIHTYYSVDRGTTWCEMMNVQGTLGYTTSNNGNKFNVYFVPDYSAIVPVAGTTVMFRVVNADAYPCNIMTMEPSIWVRKGNYVGEAL